MRLSLPVRGQKSDAGHDEILLNGKVGTSVTARRWPSSKLQIGHSTWGSFYFCPPGWDQDPDHHCPGSASDSGHCHWVGTSLFVRLLDQPQKAA